VPRVIPVSCTQVEVHLFRRRGKRLELLLLRRASQRSLAGVWQPVTGGIERDEPVLRAAEREVLEETGLRPLRWWALEHLATFYDPGRDVIRVVPVFAAEVAWTDRVDLSAEHDRYAFVSLAQASRRVLWKTQRQAIQAIRDEVFSGVASGAAREVTDRVAARGARARRAVPGAEPRTASRSTRRPAARRRRITS
jgi:8-oxo-dGTP pyrophosphatase MutT (NUDIX family)